MMKERKERRASSCADVGVGGGFGIGLWCCSDYPPAYKVAQEANRHKQRCYYFVILSRFGRLCSHWQRLLESSGQGRDLLHSAGTSLDRIDAANVN